VEGFATAQNFALSRFLILNERVKLSHVIHH
jgi:hypothetical protein